MVQIQYMDDGVMFKTLDGTIFNGSYVILAIPPPANVSSDKIFRTKNPECILRGFPMHFVIKATRGKSKQNFRIVN